jgi:hypothetical protein
VGQIFLGPAAKQQRMALMTLTAVLSATLPERAMALLPNLDSPIAIILVVIIVLGIYTAWRRLARIATLLRAKAG